MAAVKRRPSIDQLRQRLRHDPPSHDELKRLARDPRAGVRALVARERRRLQEQAEEHTRLAHMLEHETPLWNRGVLRVAGVDEAGAGPLAGPVVAAAVILVPGTSLYGVDDSKKLSAKERERLAAHIRRVAVAWAVGACSVQEIDDLNILQASREAMRRAVAGLAPEPEHLLVDARDVPGVGMGQTALVHGDARSQSIAAASILAKVERDALMVALDEQYPGYGFAEHKGYGTAAHLAALAALGPTPAHRRSFAPVTCVLPS